MRPARFVVLAATMLLLFQPAKGQSQAAAASRTPVLVELFTSEGCSDCPPADALLAQLDAEQFVQGAQAIVLSEHVTYWNHLGWSDPFSFEQIDERQSNYSRQFGLESVYTPQIVVDGESQLVGSDSRRLKSAVAGAASTPKLALSIAGAHREADGSVSFSVQGAADAKADLYAALAENATRSEVPRGENAGRTLHHVAVVGALREFGSGISDGRPLKLSGNNLAKTEKDGEPVRLVVFLVNRSNGHVVAAAEQTLSQ